MATLRPLAVLPFIGSSRSAESNIGLADSRQPFRLSLVLALVLAFAQVSSALRQL